MSNHEFNGLCTFAYSGSRGIQRRMAKGYISQWLGHPDKGSIFDKRIGRLKYLFRMPGVNGIITSTGIWYLQRDGYDAMILYLPEAVIGHTAFQVHDDNTLHIFSIGVEEGYRRMGLATHLVEKTLEESRRRKIKGLRIGGGKHKVTNHIHRNFSKRERELGIIAREGNWIDILYNSKPEKLL